MSSSTKLCVVGMIWSVMLSSCSYYEPRGGEDYGSRKLKVVTTIGMLTDTVAKIGGQRVVVTGLMGSGVDPHSYKASARDVVTMAEADLVFYNGLGLEAQLVRVLERISGRIKTVAITQDLEPSALLSLSGHEGQYDPHVWFDVSLWQKIIPKIEQALSAIDPLHRSIYQENAKQYTVQLGQLHQYVQAQAATVPASKRVLITAHDAFGYFGKAYGFEVQGLQGISTAAEASTADVRMLADFIAARRIPAIFVESSVPRRTIQAVQAAVRARGYRVEVGGELFSDAVGAAGTIEGTYIGMIRHNIDTIISSLQQPALTN